MLLLHPKSTVNEREKNGSEEQFQMPLLFQFHRRPCGNCLCYKRRKGSDFRSKKVKEANERISRCLEEQLLNKILLSFATCFHCLFI
jgi:hypothetical protein